MYGHRAVLANPTLYSQLWSLLGRPRGKQTPSTGLLAIALALGVCDHVSLYGFTRLHAPSGECAHHYWDCPAWTRQHEYIDPKHPFHDWSGEAALRERWLQRGLVVDGAETFGTGAAGAEAVRQRHRATTMRMRRPKEGGRKGRGA